ncbi:MAG: phosphonate ABC transporter, permease protein PhnE [Deltaproteobacteria bacterium]|nr:phosphonate ABC transporter, permease protein PhnE [Deltaproteobacteria bacterium]
MNPRKQHLLIGLIALIIPGAGHLIQQNFQRGLAVLISIPLLIGLACWQETPLVFAGAATVWLWSAWDAWRASVGRPTKTTIVPFLAGTIAVYIVALAATDIQPARLISGFPSIRPILSALTSPDILAYPTQDKIGTAPILVPCVEPLPRPDVQGSRQTILLPSASCAAVDDTVRITGLGFFPNFEGEMWWRNPIGDLQRLTKDGRPQIFKTNEKGEFSATIKIPLAVPISALPVPGQTQTHQIEARQHKAYGQLQPTETLRLVVTKMGETLALAFLATVLAAIFAIPIGFLAARNLMGAGKITLAVYYAVRAVLNIIRSIETLIWAIIFGVWVGLGPFAGTLALLFHSVAALGKLYSEAVESVDPRPIEAVRATGANQLQVIVFGVIPQIVPTFLSFTLYRWDINVRMATVIGLVCDAGIGFLVIQWIRLGSYNAMATSIIAITLVIAVLDYVSSVLRRHILTGVNFGKVKTFRQYAFRIIGVFVFAGLFLWSWNVADIRIDYLVRDAGNGLRLARELLTPEILTRPTELRSISAEIRTPRQSCPADEVMKTDEGPGIRLSSTCSNVGEPLTISGEKLPPDTRVYIRWQFPDGGELRVKENCCDTDADGRVSLETRVHSLADSEKHDGRPTRISIQWPEAVGGFQLSEAIKKTLDLALITLLMALIATTLGSLIAIPVSFLAARNIVGTGPLGSVLYYAVRTVFNLWRSIEPMILALIFATWVGLGPFAGVLALTLNNIPNLGKLFSEAIEEIDMGQVEALTATGANRLQVIRFAVIPQLIPKFTAFILYQWDINIRMSTVIGFVGGGGIGHQWRVWVQLNQYAAAAVATWAIVAMVWIMDYVSSRMRSRLV